MPRKSGCSILPLPTKAATIEEKITLVWIDAITTTIEDQNLLKQIEFMHRDIS